MNEYELLQAINRLVGAQLVVQESPGEFAFRHALTRDAVYTTLLLRDRRRFHRQIAKVLERLQGTGESKVEAPLADLAYHYYEGETWGKALDYSRRAGEMAQGLYAPHEAIEHFSRAVDAAGRLGTGVPSQVYRSRGQAFETIGDFEAAERDFSASLERAREASDKVSEWQALMDLGFLWASKDYARTGGYFQQALDLARTLGDPRLLAHSLNRVGNWQINQEQPDEARSRHFEALDIFQRLGDKAGVAETNDLLGMDNLIGSDLLQASRFLTEALRLFRELDDRQGQASSLTTRSICGAAYNTSTLTASQTVAASVGDAEEALRIAREIGQRSAEAFALFNLATILGYAGEYGRALSSAGAALEIGREIEHRQWTSASYFTLGCIYFDLFALAEARENLEQSLSIAREISSLFWRDNAASYLALVRLRSGEFDDARALLDEALPASDPARTSSQREVRFARAELELACGAPAVSLALVVDLIESEKAHAPGSIVPRLEKLRGDALRMLGRAAEAESVLAAARDGAASMEQRSLLWRIDVSLAGLYAGSGRAREAGRAAASARAGIESLASTLSDVRLRENFLKHALATVPSLPAPPDGSGQVLPAG